MPSDPILELGEHLAAALNRSDVLGRWMSHHLSDLLTRVQTTPSDEELVATTRETILRLWEHKAGAPFDPQPLRYLGPVLEAIGRLEPDPAPWAHYRTFRDADDPSAEDLTMYSLLKLTCLLDHEAGQLVRLGVAVAAKEATSREEAWVITASEIAESEEARAVRRLNQMIRRLELRQAADPRAVVDDERYSPDPDNSDDQADQEEIPALPSPDPDAPDDPANEEEPLVQSLREAIEHCADVISKMQEELRAASSIRP